MIDSKIPLPTDNLYKFMALAGIILNLLILIPWSKSTDLVVERIEIGGELDRLVIESTYLNEDIKKLNDETDRLKAKQDSLTIQIDRIAAETTEPISNISAKDKDRLLKENKDAIRKAEDVNRGMTEITQKLQLLIERRKEQEIMHSDIQSKKEILAEKVEQLGFTLGLATAMAVVGLLLAVPGFLFWYFRLQRYQDRIVKNKAEKDQPTKNPQIEPEEKSAEDANDS